METFEELETLILPIGKAPLSDVPIKSMKRDSLSGEIVMRIVSEGIAQLVSFRKKESEHQQIKTVMDTSNEKTALSLVRRHNGSMALSTALQRVGYPQFCPYDLFLYLKENEIQQILDWIAYQLPTIPMKEEIGGSPKKRMEERKNKVGQVEDSLLNQSNEANKWQNREKGSIHANESSVLFTAELMCERFTSDSCCCRECHEKRTNGMSLQVKESAPNAALRKKYQEALMALDEAQRDYVQILAVSKQQTKEENRVKRESTKPQQQMRKWQEMVSCPPCEIKGEIAKLKSDGDQCIAKIQHLKQQWKKQKEIFQFKRKVINCPNEELQRMEEVIAKIQQETSYMTHCMTINQEKVSIAERKCRLLKTKSKSPTRDYYITRIRDRTKQVTKQQEEMKKRIRDIHELTRTSDEVRERLQREDQVLEERLFNAVKTKVLGTDIYQEYIYLREYFEGTIRAINEYGEICEKDKEMTKRFTEALAVLEGGNQLEKVKQDLQEIQRQNQELEEKIRRYSKGENEEDKKVKKVEEVVQIEEIKTSETQIAMNSPP